MLRKGKQGGGPIAWMARNSVAANLVMILFLLGGYLFSRQVKEEVFPQVDLDMVVIAVPYPGASPEEVEQGILLAVEEVIRPLDGIKEVRSTASEGLAMVTVELEKGANKNKALTDIKNAVDRITSLPEEAERPLVNMPELKVNAISLVLYGDQTEKVMHALGEDVRDKLLQLPTVSYVELGGIKPLEISIEIPEETLRTYGLTVPQVAAQIRRTALDLPAGAVKTKGGEILLRTTERRNLGADFATIPIIPNAEGRPVTLGEIAFINDGFAEQDLFTDFEGQTAVFLDVYSVGDQSPTTIAETVKQFSKELQAQLPAGISVSTWSDMAKLYDQRMDLLLRNAMIGLVLVLVLLALFLDPKLAFWVTMGIPISFLGSFLFLPALGVSLNMISLFAFIITLGMVVDDAIVVGENAYRLRREGLPPLKAAIKGAKQMSMPVFFSIATTLAAFSPLLFIPGNRGKFMFSIPVVVMLVLIISLLESFFVLPSHLGHVNPPSKRGILGFLLRGQEYFSRGVERFVKSCYVPLVRFALRQRWVTLALGIAIFIYSLGLVTGGRVKSIDFPREESDWIVVEARLPYGINVEETRKVTKHLVQTAQEVIRENGGPDISLGILSLVGASFGRFRSTSAAGSHITSVAITLVESTDRPISSSEFVQKWREKLGDLPQVESIAFSSSTGRSSKPVDLEITHSNIQVLESAALDLAEKLRTFTGIKDIDNGIELGKPQLDFTLSPDGINAGLTTADLASQVRSAYYGAEALRQQRGRYEVKVMVRLPLEERESLTSVDEMIMRTPSGAEMMLRQAAKVNYGRSYTTINRTEGKRTIRIQADIDDTQANAEEIMASIKKDVMPELQATYPGLAFSPSGRQKDMKEFYDFIKIGVIMALLAMYGLIAVPLRSYLQPVFVVMMAIPFGFSGAVFGHYAMGMDLSMISVMGIVALSGVVVNDSLVLVSAANVFRKQGMNPFDAAIAAAHQRFRPVLLTTITTFGGLAPMIFETSVQARILIPMAVSLGFGIVFSTTIVLILVPCLFVQVELLRRNLKRSWKWIFPRDKEPLKDSQ